MKLKRNRLLILASGILLIIFIAFYFNHLSQSSESDTLSANIGVAQKAISKAATDVRALEPQVSQAETKLTQARSSFDKARGSLPSTVDSVDYGEQLLKLADPYNLQVAKLITGQSSEQKRENVTLTVTNFEMTIKGKVKDTLAFIQAMAENPSFSSASIEVVNLSGMDKEPATIGISLAIYSYKGN